MIASHREPALGLPPEPSILPGSSLSTSEASWRRIAIVGSTCSGKTTLATALGQRLGIPAVEVDALYWGPGWEPRPHDQFRALAADALQTEDWICDGNYSELRDLVWGQADALVWLDLPMTLVAARLLLRTLGRILKKEELWNGNRETWRDAFLSRDSLFLYLVHTHRRRRQGYLHRLTDPAYAHLRVVRLRKPGQVRRWLANLTIS